MSDKKIKISFPSKDPQVSLEIDTSTIANAIKEALERLPFKVEFKGTKGKK